jgi:hypothetical protein
MLAYLFGHQDLNAEPRDTARADRERHCAHTSRHPAVTLIPSRLPTSGVRRSPPPCTVDKPCDKRKKQDEDD